jgi:copper chaperone CopZ
MEVLLATQTFAVAGMSCAHCVQAVTAELARLPGVLDVQVDLASGVATVRSDRELPREAVAAAVDEAGYELG